MTQKYIPFRLSWNNFYEITNSKNFILTFKRILYSSFFCSMSKVSGTYSFNHYNRLLLGIKETEVISNIAFLNEEILCKSKTNVGSVIFILTKWNDVLSFSEF